MYTSIVVPLDGSVFANGALPVAVALAKRSDAALHLIHVRDSVTISEAGPFGAFLLDTDEPRARAEFENVAARLAQGGALRVTAEFLDGPVISSLQRYLEDGTHDLMVLMSHGRGGLSRAWLGSVADGLIRHAHVPLLLLREETTSVHQAVEPLFRRVIVPLDGSAIAEEVLDDVVALGTTDVTEYVVLTVIAPHHDRKREHDDTVPLIGRSYDEQQREKAFGYLNGVAAELRSTGAVVTVRVEVHEQRAQGILDAAVEHHVDLIALSTHGRGGISRLVHGSVADKVIRGATTAVLVHHPARSRVAPPQAAGTMASALGT